MSFVLGVPPSPLAAEHMFLCPKIRDFPRKCSTLRLLEERRGDGKSPQIIDFVICLLHIASASLMCIEHCAIQTATTMCAQAKSRKRCLPSIVGPCRIIVLHDPALLSSKRSGHCA